MRGNGFKLHQGWFTLGIRKKICYGRGCQALEQAAEGSGEVTMPVHKMCGYGTGGHGLEVV